MPLYFSGILKRKNKLEEEIARLTEEYEVAREKVEVEAVAIAGELEQAKIIIEESKSAIHDAEIEAEIVMFEAEKRALVLKQIAVSESEKGRMEKLIEEKDKQIEEMSKAKEEAEKKVEELQKQIERAQSSIEDLRLRMETIVATGVSGGNGSSGPMEYEIELITHTSIGEVDAVMIAKTLMRRSSDGWKLHSLINDEGGKALAAVGSADNFSLNAGGTSKEDRVVMIFERALK